MNHFVFSSGEIEMSDTVLGRGAFGEVRIAKWRNIKVGDNVVVGMNDCVIPQPDP